MLQSLFLVQFIYHLLTQNDTVLILLEVKLNTLIYKTIFNHFLHKVWREESIKSIVNLFGIFF